ncbi:MAG: 50S ribosomal protein L17 [Planctomycetota bacterium]
MRHRKDYRKLGLTSSHYRLMGRNMVNSLFLHERIITTRERAKEFARLAERLITLAKDPSLHHFRLILSELQDKTIVRKLLKEIAPRFKNRPGGYTRIVKLGGSRWATSSGEKNKGRWAFNRLGDNGSRVLFELVERSEPVQEKKKGKTKQKKSLPEPKATAKKEKAKETTK